MSRITNELLLKNEETNKNWMVKLVISNNNDQFRCSFFKQARRSFSWPFTLIFPWRKRVTYNQVGILSQLKNITLIKQSIYILQKRSRIYAFESRQAKIDNTSSPYYNPLAVLFGIPIVATSLIIFSVYLLWCHVNKISNLFGYIN